LARCLIVGCGCRGRTLATALQERGHVVRGTTRRAEELSVIEAAGVEGVVADPDRIVTLFGALDHVSVAIVLLGTAVGTAEQIAALHSTRLEMLLLKALDTTVRGIVYESAGTVDTALLSAGAEIVRSTCAGSRIPFREITAVPGSPGWLADALAAVDGVLDAR
jgi:nucleoside-diphosphate-sugar epimerase